MSQSLVHFLLVYSFDAGKLIHQDEFTDAARAAAAYENAESEYRASGNVDKFEVVLVGADNIETVMRTHGHYFSHSDEIPFAELFAQN